MANKQNKHILFTGFRGGGKEEAPPPAAPPPYDPTKDPGYIEASNLLTSLKPQLDAAITKMTPDQIFASLPAVQQALINAQKTPVGAGPSANWAAINNLSSPRPAPAAVVPVQAPVYQGGLFNGPNTIDPSTLSTPAQQFVYEAGLLGTPRGNQPKGSK